MSQVSELQFNQNEKVKSIYCFLIALDMKRRGIAKQLLQYVCRDAANCGFDYVEAYLQKEAIDERVVSVYQKQLDVSKAEDKDKWEELIQYAKTLGVSDNQCDFLPEDFEKETY